MNVPTSAAAIVWMIPHVIKGLVFVIQDAVQGTLIVTAAQVSDYNYFFISQYETKIIFKQDGHLL